MRRAAGHDPRPVRRAPLLTTCAVALAAAPAVGQIDVPASPANRVALDAGLVRIGAATAYTWRAETGEDAVLLEGPVQINAGGTALRADDAVIWLARGDDGLTARVALVGGALVDDAPADGGEVLVVVPAAGVRLAAENRVAADASQSRIYQAALDLRPEARPAAVPEPYEPGRAVGQALALSFGNLDSRPTAEGTAFVISGDVLVFRRDALGQTLEMQAERAVVYTTLPDVNALAEVPPDELAERVTGVYLEGDVRLRQTPAAAQVGGRGQEAERRLEADSAFYDLQTDRAVLREATLRTRDPRLDVPVTVRAQELRQVAAGVYEASRAELSTSRLAVPEYAVQADGLRLEQAAGRTRFQADDVTLRAYGAPVFYLPGVGGAIDERGFPLEQLAFENSDNFGSSVLSRWGLFETIGRQPPPGLDASYRIDYFSERNFGLGIDAGYFGSGVGDTGEATSFDGRLTGYLVPDDIGKDDLARRRTDIEADGAIRGRVLLEHNHFFPGGWQGQLRAGYASDATFLEEWFERGYRDGLPHDATAYLKRQRGTETIGVLLQQPTTDFVTTSELVAEQFQLQRLPEASYFRVGDGLGGVATFYSANRAGLIAFDPSEADLSGGELGDLGFRNVAGTDIASNFRGIPAQGFTGVDDDLELRGDFRQQLDFPLALGPIKAVPYLVGRYTGYGDSPDGDAVHRVLGGVGVRASTQFVKIDDSARSELFDVDRVRHVVEPGVHLFASASNEERDDVFIYDAQTDDYSALQAAQVSLRQRWQTKRGGPGRERSSDFLTVGVSATVFGDGPDEVPANVRGLDDAAEFRGILFDAVPENSIARDTLAADALWRVSDTTAVIGDARHNLEEQNLATAALGLAAERGERLSYFVGFRYLGEINTTFGTFSATYQVGDKYTLTGLYAVDFSEGQSRAFDLGVARDFERFVLGVRFFYDQVNDEGGVRLSLTPKGLGYGLTTGDLVGAFGDD